MIIYLLLMFSGFSTFIVLCMTYPDTMLWVLAGMIVNFFIGCAALAWVDDVHRRGFKWAKACPIPGGYQILVFFWPLTVWWIRHQQKKYPSPSRNIQ